MKENCPTYHQKIESFDYQEKEEFAEHGYHSLGFGYPLLIKEIHNILKNNKSSVVDLVSEY